MLMWKTYIFNHGGDFFWGKKQHSKNNNDKDINSS